MNPIFNDSDFTPRIVQSRYASCDPISMAAVMGAQQGVGAGFQIMADERREDAEFAHQRSLSEATNKQIEENNELAAAAYILKIQSEYTAQEEENEANAEMRFDKQREFRRAEAEAVTAAGEAGVAGTSLNNLLDDFASQEAFFSSRVESQQRWAERQRKQRLGGYKEELKGRVASIKPYMPTPIKPVDYIGPILGVVAAGTQGYNQGGGGTGPKDSGMMIQKKSSGGGSSSPWYSDGDA